MYFRVGFATDIGRKRKINQDNGGAYPEIGFFVVADGMGGHQGGETASAIVIETMGPMIRKGIESSTVSPPELLDKAIRTANRAIFEKAQSDPNLKGMGTTTTAGLFFDNILTIGHVGDSRLYCIENQQIWQLTKDHSLVQEKFQAGLISREQLKTDQMKNIITRSVGFEPEVEVELYRMKVHSGQSFLFCSDGLTGLLEDDQISQIVSDNLKSTTNVKKAVKHLVNAANSAGGDDNITTILVELLESQPE